MIRQGSHSDPVALENTLVIVPTFNERDNVAQLIETVFGLYPEIHLLIVDDSSPDGTAAVVRSLQNRYANLRLLERTQDRGFAPSYRDGFRLALGEPWCRAIVTMDADFSHNPAEIGPMVEKLASNDAVVASRYTAGGGVLNWGLRRRILSRCANWYVRTVLGLATRDATSGFACIRREALEKIPLAETVSNGYAFLVEMKFLLQGLGTRLTEHPIQFEERREGQSKMSIGKIWESVWLPWRTLWNFPAQRAANAVPAVAPRDRWLDRGCALLCALLFLGGVLATNPILETGVNDDWAYTLIARTFAMTGRIVYNGWTAVALVPQLAWGSLFFKLFGFSFTAARLSTLALVLLLIPVVFVLGRECGLRRDFAALATLLTVFSPLMLPLEISFMSDVPALLFFLWSVYAAVKAWRATTLRGCVSWALLVSLAGLAGGWERQIYWLAPLLFLPVIAWVQRSSRAVILSLAGIWIFTCVAVLGSVVWLNAQPYTLREDWLQIPPDMSLADLANHEFLLTCKLAATVALILFPVLAGFLVPGLRSAGRWLAGSVLAGVAAIGVFALQWPALLGPWLGNILTEYGVVPTAASTVGRNAVVLGSAARDAISMAVVLGCACGWIAWYKLLRKAETGPPAASPAPVVILGAIFLAGWLPVILVRSAATPAFDRYVIFLLPLASIPILWFFQVYVGTRVSMLSWLALALFAIYGVAETHDAFAAGRARLQTATALMKAGVPRTEISAGFEFDGQTQVETQGYVNNSQIFEPANAFHETTCTGPSPMRAWYLHMMPALRVRYFVALSRIHGLEEGPAGPFPYSTWLPAARREIYTQVLPGGESVACQ
jgi:dolichol-phosphate mannosyltransferase